ncbi:MAG: sulfatase-like hydrolase/transferase [Nitriliruptorales bacterium]|nr:sulfatase-like hydrolase/transferase [Nitriliruptorales bacterium]
MRPRWEWLVAVWHPLAFAAWPVVNLYQDNVGHTPPHEAVSLVGLCAGSAAAILVILALALRDIARGALAASVVVLAIMLWGPARDALGDPGWLFWVWLLAALVLAALLVRSATIVRELTTVAAAMATIVLVLALVPLVRARFDATAAEAAPVAAENLEEEVGEWSAPGEPRDIFYLVFDRYGSQAAMERRWNMDLDPFFRGLEQRGFVVTPHSKANHLRTAQSLSSTFNLKYHHDLAQRYGPDTGNMLPVYQLLEDHAVGRLLARRGYEYVHIGAWWDPTQGNRNADVNWSYERWEDFTLELFRSTLISHFERRPQGRSLGEQRRRLPYDGAFQQFRNLRRAAARPGPTFTFAHILLPHEPFVFDRNGNYISLEEEGARGRDLNYREQTLFTNELIERLLDDLLAVPEAQRPIIVLSADEGPHPVRFKADEENFDWTRATDDELEEKLAILNAYYLPGPRSEPDLYDSISPVNTWRVIFNSYFGANLPLVADRTFIFRDENHVYDFTDVTQRVSTP